MKPAATEYIDSIISSLKKIDPFKVILLGSTAQDKTHADSDIDLVVILDTDTLPKSYDEKLENKVKVRDAILKISMEIPVDLLVYSRSEYNKFLELNSTFAKEIQRTGKVLYEKVS